ncbi:MAG: hypothetical protein AB7O26_05080 [Planctomycetaceae bacterium]
MARPKLSQPGQPWIVRTILGIYEFLASLKLAVILIFAVAVVLAVATFVEANYGTAGVGFLIYHTVWFAALLALLAANIFCAAAIRFPWKRHQTGFVVTHIGLLTLLAGSAITARGNINSQLLVFLNESGQIAIDNDQSLITAYDLPGRKEPLTVRFAPGPFNWGDPTPRVFAQFAAKLGLINSEKLTERKPQLLYASDDAKLEVVDYYARSESHRVPYIGLTFYQPMLKAEIPLAVEIDRAERYGKAMFPRELGVPAEVYAWNVNNTDELRAFQECIPGETVSEDGSVVVWADGETYTIPIASLQKSKEEKKPYQIDDRFSLELNYYTPQFDVRQLMSSEEIASGRINPEEFTGPAAMLSVKETKDGKTTDHRSILFALRPYKPFGEPIPGFRADFYHPLMPGRVDVAVLDDQKFAYRAWQKQPRRVVASWEITPGQTVKTWSMGGGSNVMEMTLNDYTTEGKDGRDVVVIPLPFEKSDRGDSKRIRLRLSWKEPGSEKWREHEFWLKQNLPIPWESPSRAQVESIDVGRADPVRVSYNVKETDIGFAFQLFDFDLEVDPGTKTAANYTSHLIQIDVRDEPEVRELRNKLDATSDAAEKQKLREEFLRTSDRLIGEYTKKLRSLSPKERESLVASNDSLDAHIVTMNEPLDYPDLTGRQLRFFQETYLPPDMTDGSPLASIFRVNYDPGRPVKYLGSGLIVFGIFLMFYMRAYFFKRPQGGAL